MLRCSCQTEAFLWSHWPVQVVAWRSCASNSNVNKGLISPGTCSGIILCSWLYYWIKNCFQMSIRHPLEARCISVALLYMDLNHSFIFLFSYSVILDYTYIHPLYFIARKTYMSICCDIWILTSGHVICWHCSRNVFILPEVGPLSDETRRSVTVWIKWFENTKWDPKGFRQLL